MRNVHRSFLLAFLLYPLLLHSQTDNLLKNSGFEDVDFWTEYFTDWLLARKSNLVKQSKEFSYEGVYSAKMSSNESGVTAKVGQRVAVTPNRTIRIQHHYYITQWKEKGARMYCYFLEREAESSKLSNDYLKQYYDDKTLHVIRGGGYGLTYFPHTLNTWMTFDETITVPPNANYFIFEIHSTSGTIIYIDDCAVIEDITNSISPDLETTFSEEYYSIGGISLPSPPANGMYLVKRIYSDNHFTLSKVVR